MRGKADRALQLDVNSAGTAALFLPSRPEVAIHQRQRFRIRRSYSTIVGTASTLALQ
jgi:hypothetical protein